MSLLKKDQLQKSAGLLNSSAPEDHFLAYITADERDMLVDAGGKETPTASGIFSYQPPGDASAAESRAYHTPSERGPPGGGSGGPSGDMYYKAPPRSVVHDTGAISETSDIAKHYKDNIASHKAFLKAGYEEWTVDKIPSGDGSYYWLKNDTNTNLDFKVKKIA